MAVLLHIETATTVCSVALSQNGELLLFRELNAGFTHAENLHLFIQALLQEAGLKPAQLGAISISKGPGSYTGLRIGSSAAKGLAYALQIPLVSVDTLQVMAQGARKLNPAADFFCPMIDARRMEVYTAVYDTQLQAQRPVEALIVSPESITPFVAYSSIAFFGDGMPKCRELLSTLPNALFLDNVYPSAVDMCQLAYDKFRAGAFENTAYFEPFYLKDFLITHKKS